MMRYLQCCVYSLDCMIYFREKQNNERIRKILSILLVPVGVLRYICVSVGAMFEKKPPARCAVVAIIKNEGKYIAEFIDYYTALGCDLIIYDNDSDDDSKNLITSYKNVTYIPWHGKKRQVDAYNEACKKYRKKYKYMMFFDADEFLVADKILGGVTSLYDILEHTFQEEHRVACLGINWLIFGSSGLTEDPTTGVIDAFTNCAEDSFEWNQLVKSCVKPQKIVGWVDPHLPLQVCGWKKVNLDGKVIVRPRNELPEDKSIRLYHYFVKNKKHWEEKVEKGMADRNAKRSMDEFFYYDKNDCENKKAIEIRNYLRSCNSMERNNR